MYKNSKAKEESLGMDMKITESGNSSPRVFNCKGPEEPNLTDFPSEVLQRIFSFLPYSDLFTSTLVCRMFRDNASVPVLWKRFPIPAMEISQDDGLDRLLSVLELPRFRKIQHLDLNRVFMAIKKKGGKNRPVLAVQPPDDQSKFLEVLEIASKLPLTWLNLSYNDLPSVFVSSPQFLSRLILKIPHVDLFATCRGASSDFIGHFLNNYTEASALHTLNLGGCDLDALPTNLVTKLNYLTNVALEGAFMTMEQARAFLVDMAKGSKIKKFDIGCELIVDKDTYSDVFENLDPELVATALNNLEHVIYHKLDDTDFHQTDLDFPPDLHLSHFLEVMGKNTKLKQVEMEKNNFVHVAPEVVAKAVNNLEHFEMRPNPFKPSAQIVATLDLMAQKTKLKYVLFEYEDLSWLNPGLVARAVVQVEQVDMRCGLSRAHVRAILEEISASSRIRRLNLCGNDLSKVPTHVLESAVKFLKRGGGVVKLEKKGKKLHLKY
eukprot:GFUD01011696.1.p1 GENE.GFUD01011696.1~~GFUD01011696.1.p1  ORF type:complete len:510 (+),score=140.60 GFUD01011696.1:56-1531(+)